jgi:hypothetical protein
MDEEHLNGHFILEAFIVHRSVIICRIAGGHWPFCLQAYSEPFLVCFRCACHCCQRQVLSATVALAACARLGNCVSRCHSPTPQAANTSDVASRA